MTTETTRRAGSVNAWLRAEGIAALVAGVAIYRWAGGEWLWLLPLLLVPDLSMIGYLAGTAIGAAGYNLVHNWATALALLGLGLVSGIVGLEIAGAVLVAHVGMDRVAGYGLKYPTAFRDTHLQVA